jgi:uncharacterized protein
MPASITVRSVSSREISVGATVYRRTIAITTDRILDSWPPTPVANLANEDFAELLVTEPEVIVLGTGDSIVFPPRELVIGMARRGVGLESMDTPAAARTFNVLAGEGRRVAAVLYLRPDPTAG